MSTLVQSTIDSRYLENPVKKDIKTKMIFLGGPRQVGKTTFCQSLIKGYKDEHPAYLSWDRQDHRKRILALDWPRE
jgi:predicted AAA+ superfamily ATPase